MEKNDDYAARIASASPIQLNVIHYEILLEQIALALAAEDEKIYRERVSHAQRCLRLLMDSLDLQYDLGKTLFRIYVYVNGLLSQAFFGRRDSLLEESRELLSRLMQAWQILEKENPALPPVMENTQQVFAGLTYRNGELSEYIVEDNNRGFQA